MLELDEDDADVVPSSPPRPSSVRATERTEELLLDVPLARDVARLDALLNAELLARLSELRSSLLVPPPSPPFFFFRPFLVFQPGFFHDDFFLPALKLSSVSWPDSEGGMAPSSSSPVGLVVEL